MMFTVLCHWCPGNRAILVTSQNVIKWLPVLTLCTKLVCVNRRVHTCKKRTSLESSNLHQPVRQKSFDDPLSVSLLSRSLHPLFGRAVGGDAASLQRADRHARLGRRRQHQQRQQPHPARLRHVDGVSALRGSHDAQGMCPTLYICS